MTDNQKEMIVELRQAVIDMHEGLEQRVDLSTAVVKQQDIINMLMTIIRSLEDVLRTDPGVEVK